MKAFLSLLLLSLWALASAQENPGNLRKPNQDAEAPERRDLYTFKRFQGITGGSNATGEEFPFFALIFGSETDDFFYYCGGSLIKEDVVLTAAHCINPSNPPKRVRIGGTTNQEGESILVTETIVHPDYDEFNWLAFDFAILKLASASTMTPVILNQDTSFPSAADTPLKTIGYGATEDGVQSTYMKQVDLVYVDFPTCQATYYSGIQETLHECVDGADPTEGPCVGDSGGPLLFDETIAIGVLSFGAPCGTDGVDVYAKISDNYQWIAETAGLDDTTAPTFIPVATSGPSTPGTVPTFTPIVTAGPSFSATTLGPSFPGTTVPTFIATIPPSFPGTTAPSFPATTAPSFPLTTVPTGIITIAPSPDPETPEPTPPDTDEPTPEPTIEITDAPTAEPTEEPTDPPTSSPAPTEEPEPQTSSLCNFMLLWGVGDVFECLGP